MKETVRNSEKRPEIVKNSKSTHDRGRPTNKESKKIDSKLWDYFQKGYSVYATQLKTGYRPETIKAGFDKWTDDYIDTSDFVEQQRKAKTRLLMKLDIIREDMLNQIDDSKRALTKSKNYNSVLQGQLSNFNEKLMTIDMNIAAIQMKPIIYDKLEEYIKEKIIGRIESVQQSV